MSEPDTIKERILAAIRDSGGMTSKELITALTPDVKKQTIYPIIDRLHQAGAIHRTGLPGFRATKYVLALDGADPLVQAMARWHSPPAVDLSKQYE